MKRIAFCWFLLIFVFVVGSSAQSKPKSPTKVTKVTSDIRKVDFKNFNYGQFCFGDNSLVLRRGHQKYGDGEFDVADFSSVKYVDFDGDGKEEAFVIVEITTSGSSGGGISAYVFAYRNGAAQQIWSKCNERSGAVLGGRSILFTYPEYIGDDAHCCPSYITTDTYAWKAGGIARISKKRKPSGYK